MKNIFKLFKNPRAVTIFLSVVAVIIVLSAGFLYMIRRDKVTIENSLIEAPLSSINPTIPGTLRNVYITEGQTFKKGDQLFKVGSTITYAYTSGVIAKVNNVIGGSVTTQTPIVTFISTPDIRVDGTIDENKGLAEISVGQVVSFTVDAIPDKTFWGYVDEVSQTAKQTAAAFSISSERPTQQFNVYARFDAALHPEIKNGMSAKMTVYTKR